MLVCHFLGLKFHNLLFWGYSNEDYFYGVEKISSFFLLTGNLHYFGVLLRKETTELLPRNRFPFTLLLIF